MSSSPDVLESSQNKTSQPRYSNDVNGMYSYSDLSNIHPYDVVKTSHSRYLDFGRLTRRLICDVRCHDHRSTNMRRLKLIACPLGHYLDSFDRKTYVMEYILIKQPKLLYLFRTFYWKERFLNTVDVKF